jgi:hypothetical protein
MTLIKEVVSVVLLALAVVIMAFAFILMATAQGGGICLTKKEARQLWPRQHIYWYSKHHCWSNRRGPPKHLKMDPVVNLMAKETRAKEPEDKCCWPVLPRDSEGNIIEPLPTFSERWQNLLSVFKRWLE